MTPANTPSAPASSAAGVDCSGPASGSSDRARRARPGDYTTSASRRRRRRWCACQPPARLATPTLFCSPCAIVWRPGRLRASPYSHWLPFCYPGAVLKIVFEDRPPAARGDRRRLGRASTWSSRAVDARRRATARRPRFVVFLGWSGSLSSCLGIVASTQGVCLGLNIVLMRQIPRKPPECRLSRG